MNTFARCGRCLALAASLSACAVVPAEPYGYGYRPARVVVEPAPVAVVAPPVVVGGWWHPYHYRRW